MYERLVIKHAEHPMSQKDAARCVEWMRENISPTLDHLTPNEFSQGVALFTASALGLIEA